MPELRLRDLLISLSIVFATMVIAYYSWPEMPKFWLWKSIDFELVPNVTFFALIHLLFGLFLIGTAFYEVLEIIRINQAAHAGKNNPLYLLTDGPYEKIRHPMIGKFMLITMGFFFTLRSTLGLIFAISFAVLLHLFTLYEEKTWLIPKFGNEYDKYMIQTPARYFDMWNLMSIALGITLHTVGIFF
jgi:protein-S-isoprenylcysteine O-methyltransferase Ste14